jgi:hypothetical protein
MQLRVNIRRVKQVIWLLCVLTFVCAGWIFYQIYSDKTAGVYNPRKPQYFEDLLKKNVNESELNARSNKVFYKEERYKRLWDALVDGSIRQAPQAPVEGPPPEKQKFVVPDLSTIVDIGLIVYSGDPVERFVALTYLADAGKGGGAPGAGGAAASVGKQVRLHLSEGDPLKAPYDAAPYNGKVLRIGLQEVVFQWGDVGQEVKLNPGLGSDGKGVTMDKFKVAPHEDPSAGVDAPEESTQLKEGHWIMGTKDLARIKEDPQRFMSEELNVRSVTAAAGGRTELEIPEVKDGSLAAKYGVQSGDKVISVNGFPMSSVSAAINWAKANPGLPEYVVAYEHAGQPKVITIHVK